MCEFCNELAKKVVEKFKKVGAWQRGDKIKVHWITCCGGWHRQYKVYDKNKKLVGLYSFHYSNRSETFWHRGNAIFDSDGELVAVKEDNEWVSLE